MARAATSQDIEMEDNDGAPFACSTLTFCWLFQADECLEDSSALLEQLQATAICFEVPLPGCGIKAVSFWLDQLSNYHKFAVTLANIMNLALKDVEVGNTVY